MFAVKTVFGNKIFILKIILNNRKRLSVCKDSELHS